jgi:hypothetical protein
MSPFRNRQAYCTFCRSPRKRRKVGYTSAYSWVLQSESSHRKLLSTLFLLSRQSYLLRPLWSERWEMPQLVEIFWFRIKIRGIPVSLPGLEAKYHWTRPPRPHQQAWWASNIVANYKVADLSVFSARDLFSFLEGILGYYWNSLKLCLNR